MLLRNSEYAIAPTVLILYACSASEAMPVLNYKIMIITPIINIAVNSLYTSEIAIPQLLQADSGERLCSTNDDHLR